MKNRLRIVTFFLLSFIAYGKQEKMKISIEKPIQDNFIVINITEDLDAKEKDYRYHRVVKNDTLGGIAVTYDKTTKRLVEINELKNPDLIYPKQKIYLENKKELNLADLPEYHIVQAGENIIEIANYYELDFRDIIKMNKLRTYIVQPGQKLKLKEI